jgi:hypothetical protein
MLTQCLQIEEHPLVSFLPLDLTDPDSIEIVLSHIDYTMQYGESEEPKEVSLTTLVTYLVLVLTSIPASRYGRRRLCGDGLSVTECTYCEPRICYILHVLALFQVYTWHLACYT